MKVNPRVPPKREIKYQRVYGVCILIATYAVVVPLLYFLIKAPPSPESYEDYEAEAGWPLPAYHILLLCMLPVVCWLWALLAWLGMKLFRHG